MHVPLTRLSRFRFTLGLAALLLGAGCSRIMHEQTELSVRSLVSDTAMDPEMTVFAYVPTDRNTVDVYLSDIAASRLSDPTDTLAGVSGNIFHLHIFLMPEAGQTPIDSSACNFTVRHVVLTGSSEPGQGIGIYGGGGFCLPDSSPGDRIFDGSLREATMRLARVGPGFADRLGASRMTGSFSAPRNDELSNAISQRLEMLSRSLRDVAK
ncbi:MAG: hypothetical protein H7210_11160 [Pyrinomonadaceae bacterium]|nr:hypothetical protein [Phycisphaerales bacterium]